MTLVMSLSFWSPWKLSLWSHCKGREFLWNLRRLHHGTSCTGLMGVILRTARGHAVGHSLDCCGVHSYRQTVSDAASLANCASCPIALHATLLARGIL